jgi:hypothetical protein
MEFDFDFDPRVSLETAISLEPELLPVLSFAARETVD